MEESLARYKALLEVARCFGRALDLQTLISEILDRSREVMRAEACTLFLPDHATRELVLHSTDPRLATLAAPVRIPDSKGIAGAVFKSREKINILDAQNDARHFRAVSDQLGFVTRGMLTIPLLDGAECVGVLQALNPRDRAVFDTTDEEIFEGFGGLIANALIRVEAARRQVELARSKKELAVAREIQESFLPAREQSFRFGRVHVRYLPASEVGGDFCAVHRVGQERLLAAVGDVTGKGIPAALSMARATAMIRALLPQLKEDLGQWVSLVNEQLAQELTGGRFIGMSFLLADATTDRMQVCAAGQFAPLFRAAGRWQIFEIPNQLPLGILPGFEYKAAAASLRPGDAWIAFTDGVAEARSSRGDDFTVNGLIAALGQKEAGSALLDDMVGQWRAFSGNSLQHDDASLLLLDWRGLPPAPSLAMRCCPENLGMGRDFIERWARFAGFDEVATGQIVSACDEAASNVFRHAYRAEPGPLTYHAGVRDRWLTFQLADEAGAVEREKIRPRELDDLRPGGLGTYIITRVFDEVSYEPLSPGTILTLRKKLP